MNVLRRRLQPLSCFALVAALALALLPGMSHALAFVQGQSTQWDGICTSQGSLRSAALADGGTPAVGHTALEHCAFCSLSPGDAPLPPQAARWSATVVTGQAVLMVEVSDPSARCSWHAAQPRAPPARA